MRVLLCFYGSGVATVSFEFPVADGPVVDLRALLDSK